MIIQFCLDANVFITAWSELYPKDIFPSVWKQLAGHREKIILLKPIYDEIEPASRADIISGHSKTREKYPLRTWLIENHFEPTSIDNSVEECSLSLEQKYEINDEPKGANRNDIRLIAYAKIQEKTVVTMEKLQKQTPSKKSNYKIPLICSQENVQSISFVDMLRNLGV